MSRVLNILFDSKIWIKLLRVHVHFRFQFFLLSNHILESLPIPSIQEIEDDVASVGSSAAAELTSLATTTDEGHCSEGSEGRGSEGGRWARGKRRVRKGGE